MWKAFARAIVFAALVLGAQHLGDVWGRRQATGWQVAPADAADPNPAKGMRQLRALSTLGGRVVLLSFADNPRGDLFVLEGDGTGLRRLTQSSLLKDNPSLSRDGRRIAFGGSVNPADPDASEIYTVNADGTNLRQLTSVHAASAHPAWSPEGSRIVYARGPAPWSDLWMMNADGSGQRQLTNHPGEESDPEFMPDGQSLVFKSTHWTGKEQLALVDLSTRQTRRLTFNENSDHDPIPTPDGRWVLFERYQGPGDWWDWEQSLRYPWDIYMVAADGSGRERLLFGDGGVNWLPVPTPDGQHVLFLKATPWGVMVWAVGIDGADPRPLVGPEAGIGYLDWK